jgi:hypothetical protein
VKENCKSCQFWSETIARAATDLAVEAVCLADNSPRRGRYVRSEDRCQAWARNSHGAIDDPHCGNEAVEFYGSR